MARAKAQGSGLAGRRSRRRQAPRIAELHRAGMSIKRIRKELGIAYGTAWNYVRALEQG